MNNLQQHFCSYEISKELKELGFDESCFGYYICKNSAFGIEDLLVTIENIDLLPFDSSSCKAPLITQALEFLRKENYYIDFFVDDNKTYGFMITTFTDEGRVDSPTQRKFSTYEQAQLAGIEKAIELIKQKK